MSKDTILKNHIDFKKTSVTTKDKLKDIERYIKKFIYSSKKPLNKFTEEDLVKFLNSLDYSIGTMNGLKAHIKAFIKWYYKDYSSRFRNLDRLCRQQRAPKTYEPEEMLSLDEVKKLVSGEPDLMYKVYWNVFFYGGFRPSEALSLKWDNIFFEKDGVIIKIHTTKTKKDFYKSLPKEVEHLLKEWKQYNHSEWLFPSPQSKSHIKARSICARLKRLSKKTLGKEVVPYQLRHSIATIKYNDDSIPDDDVANHMGHTKSMKQKYVHLDEDKIKARARKLWIKTKPLTPEERDELDNLKEVVKLMADNFTLIPLEGLKKMKPKEAVDFGNNLLKIKELVKK